MKPAFRFSQKVDPAGEAYIRLKHDNATFYGLIDVVSDNGSTWKEAGKSTCCAGSVILFFDGNNDGSLSLGDKSDYTIGVTTFGGTNLTNFSNAGDFISQISVQSTLSQSPHSNRSHRIYELSIPMQPLVKKATVTQEGFVVGFAISVQDSYKNLLALMPTSQLTKLQLGESVVPENIDFLIPLLLVLAFMSLNRKRGLSKSSRIEGP